MSLKEPNFPKLRTGNYPTWKGEMTAWLRAHLLWSIVSGKESQPVPVDDKAPTEAESKSLKDWSSRSDQAAGLIYLMVEPDQRIHLQGIEDNPIKIWLKLEEVHLIKKAGSRFNAYDDLFSIRKHSEETLQELVNRIESAMQRIKNLRSDAFTLDQLDKELQVMAMLRSLPEEYNHFVSSLLIQDKLEKTTVLEAFLTYQTQQQRRSDAEDTAAKALAASNQKPTLKRFSDKQCNFCNMKGHLESDCFRYKAFKKQAQEEVIRNRSKGTSGAEESSTPVMDIPEFAGNTQEPLLI
jgi:LTR polyprotein gag-polypeptide-like protein